MSEFAIDVSHLSKKFGNKVAVDDLSLQLPKGQVWGFLGPNGSGKTTTIRMLCGLLQPTSGYGQCLGYDLVKDAEKIKQNIGYMTQQFSFWSDMTVRENLEFVARLYELRPVHEIVTHTLESMGLHDRQKQLAGTLSGGWKQRLALAAVSMHRPKLMLLDEPTAGVDPQARRDFWERIHQLADNGVTVLVSTHYMDEAERCDRIVYMSRGKILAQGTVGEIINQTGLKTVQGLGPEVRHLIQSLKQIRSVAYVAYFDGAVHVSSCDEHVLSSIQQTFQSGVQWRWTQTPLEAAFIALSQQREHRENER